MKFNKIGDTRAMFNFNDLKEFLGDKAIDFILTYRNAISPQGDSLIIKTCNFLELVINYKTDEI